MKALLSHASGGPDTLSLEDVPEPRPAEGEVLVRVHACGVNYPDTLLIRDLYQVRPQRPFSPGGEIAGVVEEVGAGVVGYAVGDAVIGRCGWGGMTEAVVLTPDRLMHKPVGMPMDDAACFLFTYSTSYFALHNRGALQPGETLLVLGASGGVGSAACELGAAMGARVIAAASTREKLALAGSKGAVEGIVYPTQLAPEGIGDLSRAFRDLAGQQGIDVVYDPVGGAFTEAALRAINPGGRMLIVGFPAGIPKLPLNLPLLKSCSVVGVNWRSLVVDHAHVNDENTRDLLALYAAGKVRPSISRRYTLAEAPQAIADLAERRATGKLVVQILRPSAGGTAA